MSKVKITKEQEQDAVLGALRSVPALRAVLKNTTLDMIDVYIEKIKEVRLEKEIEYQDLEDLAKEKEDARLAVVEKLGAANIDIPRQLAKPITVDMLISGIVKVKKPKAPKKPIRVKYATKDDNDNWLTWSGRGRRAGWLSQEPYSNLTENELLQGGEEYNEELGL